MGELPDVAREADLTSISAVLAFFAQQLGARFAALVTMVRGGSVGQLAASFNLELELASGDAVSTVQLPHNGRPAVSAMGIGARLGSPGPAEDGSYTVAAPYEVGGEAGVLLLGYDQRPPLGQSQLLDSVSLPAAFCGLCLHDPDRFAAVIDSLKGSPSSVLAPARTAGGSLAPAFNGARAASHRAPGPHLSIRTLGRTEVECSEAEPNGGWLAQRAGQLLKYMVCRRDEFVSVDECVEALWPEAGIAARNSVRHAVFALRSMLEPNRSERGSSSFVITVGGCYALNRRRVEIDVDEFERLTDPRAKLSLEALERAMAIYADDFLADEPYAEWAFPERERLRERADLALRRLAAAGIESGDYAAAESAAIRLALMWPLDADAHRAQVALCLARGHLSQAQRWYSSFRHRLQRDLEIEPDFTLAHLHNEPLLHARRALAGPVGPAPTGPVGPAASGAAVESR